MKTNKQTKDPIAAIYARDGPTVPFGPEHLHCWQKPDLVAQEMLMLGPTRLPQTELPGSRGMHEQISGGRVLLSNEEGGTILQVAGSTLCMRYDQGMYKGVTWFEVWLRCELKEPMQRWFGSKKAAQPQQA